MVRPSVHLMPVLVQYPVKSGSILTVCSSWYRRDVRHQWQCLRWHSSDRLRHWSLLGDVLVLEFVSVRVAGWLEADDAADFVGRKDLVPGEFVGDLRKYRYWDELKRITEIDDGLTLRPCCSGQERSGHGFGHGSENRFDGAVVVVDHRRFVRRAVHHFFGKAELTVKHLRQVLNLAHQIVLSRPVQLSDPLGTIRVSDSVLRALQLELDLPQPFLRFSTPRFSLNDVRQLNDDVQLPRSALLVHGVEK